jgi:hypothetical protein
MYIYTSILRFCLILDHGLPSNHEECDPSQIQLKINLVMRAATRSPGFYPKVCRLVQLAVAWATVRKRASWTLTLGHIHLMVGST